MKEQKLLISFFFPSVSPTSCSAKFLQSLVFFLVGSAQLGVRSATSVCLFGFFPLQMRPPHLACSATDN